MTLSERKYKEYRQIAKDGDILLFRGTNIIARMIQYFDKSYYNHSAVGIDSYKNIHLPTPEDFIRYADHGEVRILFHTKTK